MPIKWLITLTHSQVDLGPSQPCFHKHHDHCNAVLHRHQWYSVFHWILSDTRRFHWYIVRVLCIARHRPSNYIWDPAIQDNRRRRIPDIGHEDHSQGRKQLRKERRTFVVVKKVLLCLCFLMTAGRQAAIRTGRWWRKLRKGKEQNLLLQPASRARLAFWPIVAYKEKSHRKLWKMWGYKG